MANSNEGTAAPAEKPGDILNPFAFFREDRPLGDSPWPPDTRLGEMFEEHAALTKEKLDSVWTEFQQRHDPTAATAAEILKLKITARLKRLDIIVSQMLKACPPVDEAMSLGCENWLQDLMAKERTAVLDLVNEGAHSEDVARILLDFDENEFTQLLVLKHQEYKKAIHSERTRVIRERRLVSGTTAGTDARVAAAEGSTPESSAEPKVQNSVQAQEAPERQRPTHDDLVRFISNNYSPANGKRFVAFYKSLDVSASEFAAWRRSDHKHCGKHKRTRLDKAARELAAKL